jgi:hypothetical protein
MQREIPTEVSLLFGAPHLQLQLAYPCQIMNLLTVTVKHIPSMDKSHIKPKCNC